MKRTLGSFERAQALTGRHAAFNVVLVLRLEGRARRDLGTVLAALQGRHPLLRARLVEERGALLFDTDGAAPIPLRSLSRTGDEDWRRVAEAELGFRFETATGPLVRCAWLEPAGDGPGEIVLTFHHAIVDAAAVLGLARELLDEWRRPAPGAAPPPPAALPPAADAGFPRRWRGVASLPPLAALALRELAGEASYRWRAGRPSPPAGPVRCRVLCTELAEEQTAALIRACRRRKLTLHNTLSAALLLAVHRRRRGGRRMPMRYFAFPDLRPYLDPPVPPEVVGGYLTTMRFTLVLRREQELWELAGRAQEQLLRAARRGEKFLWSRLSPLFMRAGLRRGAPRMGDAAVSYSGVADLDRGPSAPCLRDLHAFVSLFPQAPEIAAQARLFRRRIRWDLVYLDADMDEAGARAVAGEMTGLLAAASRGSA